MLRQHGLRTQQPRSFVFRTTNSGHGQRVTPNRLLGQPRPTRLDQVWVGDITCLPAQGRGWLYLASWQDACSRKVVGWDLCETMPEDLVSEALRRALVIRQPAAGLLVHSDQGSQYAAIRFQDLVTRHGAVSSMSRRGTVTTTPTPSRFGAALKTELLDGGSFPGLAEARLEISHYLAYYNAERRHSAPGYQLPNHFETHFQTTS